jgi:hypothetical protein
MTASKSISAKQTVVHCSFCGRDSSMVRKMIAGPGVTICNFCVASCNDILEGRPVVDEGSDQTADEEGGNRAEEAFGHWDRLESDALLAAVRRTDDTLNGVRAAQGAQVEVLRERGVSWNVIGQALGTSRQAAWERFGRGEAAI